MPRHGTKTVGGAITAMAAPHPRPEPFELLAGDPEGAHDERDVGPDGEHRRSKAGDTAGERWTPLADGAV